MKDISGKTAIVTGAASGIGLAIATAFAEAAPIPIDADRDQHRLADNHTGLAHPLVARVEDQIGEGFGQRTASKLRQTHVQPLVHRTDLY